MGATQSRTAPATPTTIANGDDRPPTAAERAAEQGERQRTADWALAHPEAFQDYMDEWVAMVGQEIVVHGPSMTDALEAAKARGYDDPLLVPMTPPQTIILG